MIGPEPVRFVIRGFADGEVRFEESVDAPLDELDSILAELAKKHADAMVDYDRHVIEFEFLDEPDPLQRFLRFGTDISMMKIPMRIR